jgi:hypothetical protein
MKIRKSRTKKFYNIGPRRRFANLFETSQSLFWASFGLVSLSDFELTGIKEFTR